MNSPPHKTWFIILFYVLSAVILLSGRLPAEAAEKTGIKIMEKELIGKYLADSQGMSLYTFAKDEENSSNCIEGCALNWPPFYGEPSAGDVEGYDPDDFGIITRIDGRRQTTYQGMPLYYFKNDRYPGDTFGHGLGDVWFLVIL